jgi:hypothetical protein
MEASTVGLILNFAGALILAISANLQGDVITNIVDSISDNYGTFGAEKIGADKIMALRKKKRLCKILNWIGYALFAGGFLLQIICVQANCFKPEGEI